eukprot:TRINITY_DN16638_c0_g1_i1.p1 TRINITY_DN16638_c0_g1~~TRINITY_DN16638_c0_g1_i1.p1  ORF type:complete len:497 (-),score=131.35 TRINITY_DN16638_c0_g1_i1:148-1638(-)
MSESSENSAAAVPVTNSAGEVIGQLVEEAPRMDIFEGWGSQLSFIVDNVTQKKVLSHGSMQKVVHFLFEVGDMPEHSHIIAMYILVYRQFLTDSQLFKLVEQLIGRCIKDHQKNCAASPAAAAAAADTPTKKKRKRERRPVHAEGATLFLISWLKNNFAADFFDDKDRVLYNRLLGLLEKMVAGGLGSYANRVKLYIVKCANAILLERGKRVGKSIFPRKRGEGDAAGAGDEVDENSNKNLAAVDRKLPRAKTNFLDMNVTEVAEALTLLESRMYLAIRPSEFLNLAWKGQLRSERSAHVVSMVERFNMVSFWVATEVVLCSDIKKRIAMLKKFIALAERCLELGNYNTVMEILGGINNVSVQRLKKTWEALPEKYATNLSELNEMMETKHNYKRYRDSLQNEKGAVVPYLGIFLRDLTFIEEGNPNYIDTKYINFQKMLLLGAVVQEVQQFQTKTYALEKRRGLERFLSKLLVLPDEVLYKHSLQAEPPNKEVVA